MLLWVAGGAVVAGLAATIVGIGAALMTVLLFVPVVAMLGFVVSGMWLGRFILGLFNRETAPDHPYLTALTGVGALALVGLIPVIGALLAVPAMLWGTGALAYQAWHSFRGPARQPEGEPVPGP